jgi:hypothetical protein
MVSVPLREFYYIAVPALVGCSFVEQFGWC